MNFIVSAIALFIASLYWLIVGKYLDKRMVDEDNKVHGNPHLPVVKEYEPAKEKGGFVKVIISSGMALILPVLILQSVFSLGVQAVAPSMFAESYEEVTASIASLLTIIPVVVGVMGKFVIKAIYKKKTYNECLAMAVCLLALLPVFGGMMFVGKINIWIMVFLVSMIVLISSASSTLPFTYMAVRFSRIGKGATISGLVNAMSAFGVVLANYISPRVADAFNNNWVPVILVWTIFALVSALISFIAFYPWKKFIKTSAFEIE